MGGLIIPTQHPDASLAAEGGFVLGLIARREEHLECRPFSTWIAAEPGSLNSTLASHSPFAMPQTAEAPANETDVSGVRRSFAWSSPGEQVSRVREVRNPRVALRRASLNTGQRGSVALLRRSRHAISRYLDAKRGWCNLGGN